MGMSTAPRFTLYVHPYTYTTKDYGSVLSVEKGCIVTHSGDPQDARGPLIARTPEAELARMREVVAGDPDFEFRLGVPVTRSFDMNPHGFI